METLVKQIKGWLQEEREEEYQRFQGKLIPNLPSEHILGVRMPKLRAYAKEMWKKEEIGAFLEDLPHGYFEENQLHILLISKEKSYDLALEKIEVFLPYIDNWASCDLCTPMVFRKHRKELIKEIPKWLEKDGTYIKRFGIKMLMDHFLGEEFQEEYLDWVVNIESEEYYVNMMRAWYLATALAKQYERVLPTLESNRMDVWTHNKSIQKAVESRRLSQEQKEYLIKLRRKGRSL